MLAEKLNMTPDEAEKWIVNLIRNARLDAKIDSKQVREKKLFFNDITMCSLPRQMANLNAVMVLKLEQIAMVLSRQACSSSGSSKLDGRDISYQGYSPYTLLRNCSIFI